MSQIYFDKKEFQKMINHQKASPTFNGVPGVQLKMKGTYKFTTPNISSQEEHKVRYVSASDDPFEEPWMLL